MYHTLCRPYEFWSPIGRFVTIHHTALHDQSVAAASLPLWIRAGQSASAAALPRPAAGRPQFRGAQNCGSNAPWNALQISFEFFAEDYRINDLMRTHNRRCLTAFSS